MELIDREFTINKIWSIGGDSGWYGDWLWNLHALLILYGGVGSDEEEPTDTIYILNAGFWRVLYANKEEGKLILFAEMKLQGLPNLKL
jgi:hypothetical protein